MLRHTLATVAYRAIRALEGAPDHFAGFAGAGRLPVQILAHMGDLFDWALSMAIGRSAGKPRSRAPGPRSSSDSSSRSRPWTPFWPPTRRFAPRPSGFSRVPWPMRSPTWASWPCCAASLAAPLAGRIFLSRRSRPGRWARLSLRLSNPSSKGSRQLLLERQRPPGAVVFKRQLKRPGRALGRDCDFNPQLLAGLEPGRVGGVLGDVEVHRLVEAHCVAG